MDQIPDPDKERPIAKPSSHPPSGAKSAKGSAPPNPDSDTDTDKSPSRSSAKRQSAKPASSSQRSQAKSGSEGSSSHIGVKIADPELIKQLDTYSIEDIVELKIARFLDQLGGFYPENMHELIMCKVEKPLIIQILRQVGGNQVHAAKILGINRNTLRKKMKLYNVGV